MRKPKRCPFCGRLPAISSQPAPKYAGVGISVMVQCGSGRCGIRPSTAIASFYIPDTRDLSWEEERAITSEEIGELRKSGIEQMIRIWNSRRTKP